MTTYHTPVQTRDARKLINIRSSPVRRFPPSRTALGWLHQVSDTVPTYEMLGHAYVYVVAVNSWGPVKIGYTRRARSRVKSLETARGERFPLIWISEPCANYADIEQTAHAYYAKYRKAGEWFTVPFDQAVPLIDSWNIQIGSDEEYQAMLRTYVR